MSMTTTYNLAHKRWLPINILYIIGCYMTFNVMNWYKRLIKGKSKCLSFRKSNKQSTYKTWTISNSNGVNIFLFNISLIKSCINNPINKNLFIHLLFYSGKSTGPLFHPGYTLVTKASNNRFKSVTRPTKQLHSPSKKATFAAD